MLYWTVFFITRKLSLSLQFPWLDSLKWFFWELCCFISDSFVASSWSILFFSALMWSPILLISIQSICLHLLLLKQSAFLFMCVCMQRLCRFLIGAILKNRSFPLSLVKVFEGSSTQLASRLFLFMLHCSALSKVIFHFFLKLKHMIWFWTPFWLLPSTAASCLLWANPRLSLLLSIHHPSFVSIVDD